MAFPTVVSTAKSSVNTAGTSHAVTLPASIAATDLVLITMDIGSTSATLNALTDWAEILDEASANGLKILRYTGSGVPSNPTFTSSANTRSASIAWRISGVNKAITPQIGTTGTGTSATPDPPASANPPSTKDYLFIAFAGMAGEEADDDTWGNTPPTDYLPSPPLQKSCGTAGTNLGGLIVAASRQLNTGSAEDPGSFGVDTSAAWRSQTITIHPIVNETLTPTTLAHTLTTFAPTVTATQNQRVTPTTLALVIATFAPTIRLDKIATPTTLALTITTFAPTVSTPLLATPTTLALTLTTFEPTVSTTANVRVTPDTAGLTTTAFEPTISTPQTVTPTTVALVISTFAPTVQTPILATPTTLSLTLTAFAPTVQTPTVVTPAMLSLSLATFAPTVVLPQTVTPATVALTLTTFAPSTDDNVEVVPPTIALTATRFAPTVTVGENVVVTPTTATLTLSQQAPTVSVTTPPRIAAVLTIGAENRIERVANGGRMQLANGLHGTVVSIGSESHVL